MSSPIQTSGAVRVGSLLWRAGRAVFRCALFAVFPLAALTAVVSRLELNETGKTEVLQVARLVSARFSEHPIRNLNLAADGRTAWVSRFPAIFERVDLATGVTLAKSSVPVVFAGHPQLTSPPRQAVLYASDQGTVLHSLNSMDKTIVVPPLGREIACFAANPFHDVMAVAQGATIEVRSLATLKAISQVQLHNEVRQVLWSPDGFQLLVCETDGTLHLLEGTTLERIQSQPTSLVENTKLLWSRQGRRVAAYSESAKIVVWDLMRNEVTSAKADVVFLRTVAISPDGHSIAYADVHDQVWLLFPGEKTEPQLLGTSGSMITSLLFDTEGNSLLIGGMDGRLERWSLANGAVEWSVRFKEDDDNGDMPSGKSPAITRHPQKAILSMFGNPVPSAFMDVLK